MSLCIVYLASPKPFTIQTLEGEIVSRQVLLRKSVEITRTCFPSTDIFVFHEDYTDEDKASIPGVAEFLQVDFSGKGDVYNPAFGSKGYLMMCRFFSGVLQAHPILQKYTHYMRLDDDSFFQHPYPTQINFQNHDYVFRSLFHEGKSQQSLYEFTMNFLLKNGMTFLQKNTLVQNLVRSGFLTSSGTYTGIAPYNNFHISSLRLWKHPLVSSYIRSIEESNGIFRNGWLDANIHAMIIFLVHPHGVSMDTGFGYRHNNHESLLGNPSIVYRRDIPFYPK